MKKEINFLTYEDQSPVNIKLVTYFLKEKDHIHFRFNDGDLFWEFTCEEDTELAYKKLLEKINIESLKPTSKGYLKVNLTYFKDTGKYYSEGSYLTKVTDLNKIWNDVIQMARMKRLPDLVKDHSDFIILINVPDHPNDHPKLIL